MVGIAAVFACSPSSRLGSVRCLSSIGCRADLSRFRRLTCSAAGCCCRVRCSAWSGGSALLT